MCTIVAIKGVHPRYPLIVAANRDEYYARASSPPQVVHERPRAVAGLDRSRGGSWMGANERGVLVAVTNQRTYGGADPSRASRGEIVIAALAQPDVEGVDALVRSIDAREYNSFNLIWGDARALRVGYARTEAREVEITELGDGLHVLANDRMGSPEFPKSARAEALALPLALDPWERLAPALAGVLADHQRPAIDDVPEPPEGSLFDRATLRELQALCIHTPVYGTRSATLLALAPGRVAHYLFADGPPCTAPFREITALLHPPSVVR